MRPKTYTEEQVQILKKYYPSGDWGSIMPHFPNKNKADIRAIARKNSIRRKKQLIKDEDITGQRFYKLTAVARVDSDERFARWKCKCDCGNETIVDIYKLKDGTIKSCGCIKHTYTHTIKDFTNCRFGYLTAVERLPRYKGKGTFYRCICDCGREKIVCSGNLTSGHTRSCGVMNHTKKEFQAINVTHDDNKRIYSIYRHIAPNGKSYIGITKQNPERRFQHGYGYKTQPPFWRAIQKYGWENFKHEILEENLTEKEACEKEAYYIAEVFNSFTPNGYNTREGGTAGRNNVTPIIQYYEGIPVNFFDSISDAVKRLGIAEKTIKIHCGEENAIENYCFAQLDSIAPYDIPEEYWELNNQVHLDAMKGIIAKDLHDRTVARNKAGSKAVNKYDLDGHYICTFSSLTDARDSIEDYDGGAIDAAVNPKRQGDTAYGFMWKYDTGNHDDIEPIKYKAEKRVVKYDKVSGAVLDTYKSMTVAAEILGVGIYRVRQACNGKDSIFESFYLRYKE